MSSDTEPSAKTCAQEQVSDSDDDEYSDAVENSDNDNGAFNVYGRDDSKIDSDSNSNHYARVRGHAVAFAASNTSLASHHATPDNDDMELILQQIKELEKRETYTQHNTHNISQDENIDDILKQIKQFEEHNIELNKRRDEILQQDYDFNKSLENDRQKDNDIKCAIFATSINTITGDSIPTHKVNFKNDDAIDDNDDDIKPLPKLTPEQLRLQRLQYFNKMLKL